MEKSKLTTLPFNCLDNIGYDFHFVMACKQIHEPRTKYIKPFYDRHPNILKFEQIMNIKLNRTQKIMRTHKHDYKNVQHTHTRTRALARFYNSYCASLI